MFPHSLAGDATWVYCIDSYCDAPKDGVSQCYCWIQASGKSSLPASGDGGAPCVLRETSNGDIDNPFGDAMCESMESGELWSTFGYLGTNTTYLPPFTVANCPASTPMTYCWGAKCRRDPDPSRPNGAICDCPFVTSNDTQIDIQVAVEQCDEQEGKQCDFLHNGNVAAVTTSEDTEYVLELYQNITGSTVPVVPTCENRPDTEPVSLEAVGCAEHVNYDCTTTDTPWVYCIDAYCDAPINGTSTCKCWNQAPGKSVAPGSANSGATCVVNEILGRNHPFGEDLCAEMKAGQLVSTFGAEYGNTSFVPEFALQSCEGGFAYCWGAFCKQDPANPDIAICECPFVESEKGSVIAIAQSQCTQQQGNECSYMHNGGPRSTAVSKVLEGALEFLGTSARTCNGTGFDLGYLRDGTPSSTPSSTPDAKSSAVALRSLGVVAAVGLLAGL